MTIKTKTFSSEAPSDLKPGSAVCKDILPGEVAGVRTELLSIRGPHETTIAADEAVYTVLLVLAGRGKAEAGAECFDIAGESIIRLPVGEDCRLEVPAGEDLLCLRIAKSLDQGDLAEIVRNRAAHSSLYAKRFADCPSYREDIKSAKTVNRMLLDKGLVPRFCMGTVETTGPDTVAKHVHPMLDQLFLGLQSCRCSCHADNEKAILTENCLLHIPLGSEHWVSVDEGDALRYVWLDFFLTLEGQSYMSSQHEVEPGDTDRCQ